MANAAHPSDSSAQRHAGREMLDRLSVELGARFEAEMAAV